MIYKNELCVVASLHDKAKAIEPSFKEILGFQIEKAEIDTDQLGTFTGEIERKLAPLDCVREKCKRGLEFKKGIYGVASEASFGPHPEIPFISSHHEILFFMDLKRGFEVSVSNISLETNFNKKKISTIEELKAFADSAKFPTHALILRSAEGGVIYKGIQDHFVLVESFEKAKEASKEKGVLVETDMRAHMNPSRMNVISQLAKELAYRLISLCPSCQTPGFGVVKRLGGLLCHECDTPTPLIAKKILGCCKCDHAVEKIISTEKADPQFCMFCNP